MHANDGQSHRPEAFLSWKSPVIVVLSFVFSWERVVGTVPWIPSITRNGTNGRRFVTVLQDETMKQDTSRTEAHKQHGLVAWCNHAESARAGIQARGNGCMLTQTPPAPSSSQPSLHPRGCGRLAPTHASRLPFQSLLLLKMVAWVILVCYHGDMYVKEFIKYRNEAK